MAGGFFSKTFFGARTVLLSSKSGSRIALVIGNGNYAHVPVLRNPVTDARALGQRLDEIGFDSVDVLENLDLSHMKSAVMAFRAKADKGEVAAVYFAGHGIEIGGENYLVPIDARLADDRDVPLETFPLSQLRRAVERSQKLKFIVLDACRENPFLNRMARTLATRSVAGGLAEVADPRRNEVLLFAAQSGRVAIDGQGANSPLVQALLEHIPKPGLEINALVRVVCQSVREMTGGRQEPIKFDSLDAEPAFLVPPLLAPVPAPQLVEQIAEIVLPGHDLFISYKSEERELPKKLVSVLHDWGYSGWWDIDGLAGGDRFRPEIEKAIEAARGMTVIWTRASAASEWVEGELKHGRRLGKHLFPLHVPPFDPDTAPMPFNNRQSTCFGEWKTLLTALLKKRVFPSRPIPVQASAASEEDYWQALETISNWKSDTEYRGMFLRRFPTGKYASSLSPERVAPSGVRAPPQAPAIVSPSVPLPWTGGAQVRVAVRLADGRDEVRTMLAGGGAQRANIFNDQARDTRTGRITIGPDMVAIPDGSFDLGATSIEEQMRLARASELPRLKNLIVSKPFAVSRAAITVREFRGFAESKPHIIPEGLQVYEHDEWVLNKKRSFLNPGFEQTDRHPVVGVSYDDACAYAAWLSQATGRRYRLLTETEWEYAARAETTTPFWWGLQISTEFANFDGRKTLTAGAPKGLFRGGPMPALSLDANPWGLFHVHGNIWEWVADPWTVDYAVPRRDAATQLSAEVDTLVVRGGSWLDAPNLLRAATRTPRRRFERTNALGFRVARDIV